MKKMSRKSKSGFTLLEVLLAVVILTIASTMIMKGFVAVMIFGRNNRNYSRFGTENYRQAMSDSIAQNATSSTQFNTMTNLTDNSCSELTMAFAGGTSATGVDPAKINICVDVSSYSDSATALSDGAYALGGVQSTESESSANNRFAFFYDLGDYLGPTAANNGHVIRWGFVMSAAQPSGSESSYLNGIDSFYNQCFYVDKDGDGLVGADDPTNASNEFVGYVHYGWYCFNPNHNESNCPYRGFGANNRGYVPAHQH